MGILFDMGSGSTYETGTTAAWQNGDYFRSTGAVRVISTLNATWQVTGVQLETGTVATPFERRGYGQEYELCKRYYEILSISNDFVPTNSTACRKTYFFSVTKRVAPTMSGTVTVSTGTPVYDSQTINSFTLSTNSAVTAGFSGNAVASAELV